MNSLSQEVTIIVIGCAFFLLVAIGIIILVLIYQKKQLRYILEKAELEGKFQHELIKTRLEAQDDTLHQLSKELHDNIGQLLSSSKFLIGAAGRSSESVSESLKMADETLAQAISELRAMSKSLNTNWLEKFNLIENLKAESERINSSHTLTVLLTHPPEISMAPDRQLMLFRIVQESIQNSIKHGQASEINILAEQQNGLLKVAVIDNGRGFNPADAHAQGVGMINIKNRAQLMGGEARWHSIPGKTSVEINLPSYAH